MGLQKFLQQLGPATETPVKPVVEAAVTPVATVVAEGGPSLPPVAPGFTRVPLDKFAQEELFLLEAIHGDDDWRDPERVEAWAPKRQLAETARDLAQQNVLPRDAYSMSVHAGFTGKEAGYIAKLVRDGDWRLVLEGKRTLPKVDRLRALLAAA